MLRFLGCHSQILVPKEPSPAAASGLPGACVQWGSSMPRCPCPLGSLMFGIPAAGNSPTEPWSPNSPAGIWGWFSSPRKIFLLPGGFGRWGQTLSSSRLPSTVMFPWLRQDPFLPVWDTGSMGVQHHSQLIQTLGKSLLLPTPIPFGLPGTPSRAGSSGMGICASQCVGSLWSSSWGWGRSVGQEDLPRAEG